MTKADKKVIQKLIKGLPIMRRENETVKQTVYGSTLIEKGHPQKDIKPNGRYLISVPVTVNHKTECEKLFKQHGILAVKGYCEKIVELATKQRNESKS